jgi:hypothetical protein
MQLKQFPIFKTDEDAERFVDEADLSEYDFRGMIPLSEFNKKRLASEALPDPTPALGRLRQRPGRGNIPGAHGVRT